MRTPARAAPTVKNVIVKVTPETRIKRTNKVDLFIIMFDSSLHDYIYGFHVKL
jgi:hypothetical protein